MLGLERVLAEDKPHLASGTELRRHQIDALAGMLTELIAAHEKEAEPNGNGAVAEMVDVDAEAEDEDEPVEESVEDVLDEEVEDDEQYTGPDPGAARRYRFRHPTASGKTIAAAGFVEAARSLGVLILTHRRLLVSQFQRDLTDEGYSDRFAPPSSAARNRCSATPARSPSRPTPGSRATTTRSRARRTSSSSATKHTPHWARRRARRSARSRSRSTSA